MSLIQAIATIDVHNNNMFERKKVEVTVDESTLRLAMTSSGLKQLEGWAKGLFPAADRVEVCGIQRMR